MQFFMRDRHSVTAPRLCVNGYAHVRTFCFSYLLSVCVQWCISQGAVSNERFLFCADLRRWKYVWIILKYRILDPALAIQRAARSNHHTGNLAGGHTLQLVAEVGDKFGQLPALSAAHLLTKNCAAPFHTSFSSSLVHLLALISAGTRVCGASAALNVAGASQHAVHNASL